MEQVGAGFATTGFEPHPWIQVVSNVRWCVAIIWFDQESFVKEKTLQDYRIWMDMVWTQFGEIHHELMAPGEFFCTEETRKTWGLEKQQFLQGLGPQQVEGLEAEGEVSMSKVGICFLLKEQSSLCSSSSRFMSWYVWQGVDGSRDWSIGLQKSNIAGWNFASNAPGWFFNPTQQWKIHFV